MKAEELQPRLKAVAGEIASPKQIMRKATLIAERASKKAISSGPTKAIKTGTLRRSINSRVLTAQKGVVGAYVKYAKFVHEGTRYMHARPFFEVGLRDAKPEIEQMLQEEGQALLDGVGK